MPRVKIHVVSREGAVEVEMEDPDTTLNDLGVLALGIAEKLADVAEPTTDN